MSLIGRSPRFLPGAWPVHRLCNLSCCFVLDDSHWIKVVWSLTKVLACIPLGNTYIKQFWPYLLAICIASFKNSPFRPMALCCSFVFYRLIRFIAGIFFVFLKAAFTCDWQFPLLCKTWQGNFFYQRVCRDPLRWKIHLVFILVEVVTVFFPCLAGVWPHSFSWLTSF